MKANLVFIEQHPIGDMVTGVNRMKWRFAQAILGIEVGSRIHKEKLENIMLSIIQSHL